MNKELACFYYVSDKIPAEIIRTVTRNCGHLDCKISARIQETTCAGVSQYYDKTGKLDINDRNEFTVHLCCITCKHGWKVTSNKEILEELDFG